MHRPVRLSAGLGGTCICYLRRDERRPYIIRLPHVTHEGEGALFRPPFTQLPVEAKKRGDALPARRALHARFGGDSTRAERQSVLKQTCHRGEKTHAGCGRGDAQVIACHLGHAQARPRFRRQQIFQDGIKKRLTAKRVSNVQVERPAATDLRRKKPLTRRVRSNAELGDIRDQRKADSNSLQCRQDALTVCGRPIDKHWTRMRHCKDLN